MMSCAQVERVEELVLGTLGSAAASRVVAHLAGCAVCAEAHAAFAAERALFGVRAAWTDGTPPLLALPLDDVKRSSFEEADRRGAFARVLPALLAVAACIAGIAGGELRRTYLGDGAGLGVTLEPARGGSELGEEPLACAFPVSGVVHVTRADESLACAAPSGAGQDRSTCEEPIASRQRVTSSFAAP